MNRQNLISKDEYEYVPCNYCGADDFTVLYEKTIEPVQEKDVKNYRITSNYYRQYGQIVKCNSCQLVYVNPRIHHHFISDIYKNLVDKEYLTEIKQRQKTFKRNLNIIEKHIKAPGKLLDVGCGAGLLLDIAKRKGCDVCGVDLSSWAVNSAKQLFDIDVFCGTLQDAKFPDSFFDIVTIVDVIEHVTDPAGLLKEVGRIIKDNGILFISTPNIDSIASKIMKDRWWFLMIPHIYYFSSGGLGKMVNNAGFKIIKRTSYGRNFSLRYLLLRTKYLSYFLTNVFNWLVEKFGLTEKTIYINLFDQMLVVANKDKKP